MRKKLPNKKLLTLLTISFAALVTLIYIKTPKNNQPECANSISCIKNLSGDIDTKAKEGEFEGKIVKVPRIAEPHISENILGESSNKRIEVDLTSQKLHAIENENIVYSFDVSTGLYDWTPTGDFHIWIKLRATRMQGGSKEHGTYYNLPNVPYTMYFYNDQIPKWRGFGIHGAYWHNDFGTPRSHGCINMRPEEAAILYAWAHPDSGNRHTTSATAENPGTLVRIYGDSP